jgi:hypothetical protein
MLDETGSGSGNPVQCASNLGTAKSSSVMKTDLKVRAAGTHPMFPETRDTKAFRSNQFQRSKTSAL